MALKLCSNGHLTGRNQCRCGAKALTLKGPLPSRPRKEADKLKNFIRRTSADVEVLLSKTTEHYRCILEAMDPNEAGKLTEALTEASNDLAALADTLRSKLHAVLPRAV